MEPNVRLRREIYRILVAISAGEATDDQHARLDALVRAHAWARECVVDAMTHISDLEWEIREDEAEPQRVVRSSSATGTPLTRGSSGAPATAWREPRRTRWSPWSGAVAAFALGVAAALAVVVRMGFQRPGEHEFVIDNETPVARLVSNTSFMIDSQAGRTIKEGEAIHAGRAVTLFDGAAEIEFANHVTLRLRGPALLAIDAEGVPHVKYGRVILANQGQRSFKLALPLAGATIAQNAYVGLDCHGDDAFVYAFEGSVELLADQAASPTPLHAGAGMRVRRGARSDIVLTAREIDPTGFDFELLMASDQINVSSDYVQAVEADHPVAYWRFEDQDARKVKNEMGPSHALEAHGDGVRIASRDGNGVAEFVVRDEAATLTSVDAWDDFKDRDYSLEMWVKPSHFQWGTMAALVEHAVDKQGDIERHAMLVELQSANAPPEGRSKSIRFLHRSPPSDQPGGTSCFSSVYYRAQIWQHVAAVKRGDQLNLYLNGELVASATDATHLPGGLRLIVGQLFSFGSVRPFVGHIDEMAVYDRALSADEIRHHVGLMRGSRNDVPQQTTTADTTN